MNLTSTLERLFVSTTPRHFRLSHGLVLSYNPQQQTFRIGRLSVAPSADEIITVRRDAKAAGVLLHDAPVAHQVDGRNKQKWHYVEWQLEAVQL